MREFAELCGKELVLLSSPLLSFRFISKFFSSQVEERRIKLFTSFLRSYFVHFNNYLVLYHHTSVFDNTSNHATSLVSILCFSFSLPCCALWLTSHHFIHFPHMVYYDEIFPYFRFLLPTPLLPSSVLRPRDKIHVVPISPPSLHPSLLFSSPLPYIPLSSSH